MTEKACRTCRTIVVGQVCSLCNSADALTKTWEGYIFIVDTNSEIAAAIGAKAPGKYALKIK